MEGLVVAFAFGVPDTILSNRHIAGIALQRARKLNAVVYTQRDIHIVPCYTGVGVLHISEEPGNPPPTLRIARGAVWVAKRYGAREVWVAAAKPHLWRCLRDMNVAVREVGGGIVVRACEEIEQIPEDEWFCLNSTQERTQSREAWEKRERVLSWMPLFIYKRVAS